MFSAAGAFKIRWQTLVKLGAFVLLIVIANLSAGWIAEDLRLEVRPSNEDMVHKVIMISSAIYALLLAVPFVPGVEIGLTLIALLGAPIVFLVYLCTLLGLSLAFTVGRLLPLGGLIKLLEDVRLSRVAALLRTIEPMSSEERLAFLAQKAPNRLVPFLLRHRYLALALLLNIPGNVVIGGGGGIALVSGVSRLYSVPGFLVTIVLAVLPVPLAILFFGSAVLPD